MARVTLEVPDEVVEKLSAGGDELAQVLRLAAAFSLGSRGELTASQAARLAGLTYAGFLEAAAREKVDLFQYTIEELEEELARPLPDGVDVEAIKEELARARAARG
jgi:predicted HTH domain antitoxin